NFHITLMKTYYKLEDYRNALKSADSILALDDKQAKAYYYKGLCEEKTKYDIKGVLISLRKAVELEPNEILYRIALAKAYKDYGFYRSALKEWQRIAANRQYAQRALMEIQRINSLIEQSRF
ncbi:MAG: hypothetical protein D6734_05190, partial [Candidatus Schekmanbacteria bacterium]